jgi:hypothetical protein
LAGGPGKRDRPAARKGKRKMAKTFKGEDDRGPWRAVYSVLLEDPDFLQLHPEVRLVFLALRLSRQCNPICLFPLSVDALITATGLSRDRVEAGIMMLVETGWIAVEEGMVWIKNGLRFSPGWSLANLNHVSFILRLVRGLPKRKIVNDFLKYYGLSHPPSHGVSHPRSHPPSHPPIPSPIPSGIPSPIKEKEKEKENKEKKNKKEKKDGPPKGDSSFDPFFETFWEEYPSRQGQKRGKRKAFKEWKALKPDQDLRGKILSALKIQKQNYIDCKKHGEFVPEFQDPERWLKNRRWEDEVKLKTWQERLKEMPE